MCKESEWDIPRIQSYINDAIEENSKLEYKESRALKKTDGKKSEITKDISSMANASGGILIYGIAEFSDKPRQHLPERISPIKRNEISREWLDQVISNINPPIKNCLIYSVDVGTAPEDVVYIVEIPQSETVHQANDGRYYRRRNTTTQRLEHYEIVDIMNRRIHPDVDVEFNWKYAIRTPGVKHIYNLIIKIINKGPLIEHYQLDFTFKYNAEFSYNDQVAGVDVDQPSGRIYSERVRINSENVLFPSQELDFSNLHRIEYPVNNDVYSYYSGSSPIIHWTLYADQMQPKTGIVEFQNLNNF